MNLSLPFFYKDIDTNPYNLNRALEEILKILKTGIFSEPLNKDIFLNTFYIISFIKNNYIRNKIVIAYSKSLYNKYIKSMNKIELLNLCKQLNLKWDGEKMPIEIFLSNAPDSPHYYLYYLDVKDGFVYIESHMLKRLIQESITKYLTNYKLNINEKDIDSLNNIKNELMKIITKIESNKVKIKASDYPPCIKKILSDLYQHKNLSHYARWVLAVYLFNIGMSMEKIKQLYSNLPDYNEKITTYQLTHIFNRKYTMPSCNKMVMYGLCVSNCNISNPIRWRHESKRYSI